MWAALCIAGWVVGVFFIVTLCRAAAPSNLHERTMEDEGQTKALRLISVKKDRS